MSNPDKLYVFIDESGNTGSRHLDPKQPFFVLAAWIVRHVHLDACRACVKSSRARTRTKELKTTRLLRRDHGRRVALELIQQLLQIGAMPMWILCEKRYVLAARFVDEFLDPAFNDVVGWKYCSEPEQMQAAADMISRLDIGELASIEHALRDRTVASRRAAVDAVQAALRARGHFLLADEVAASLRHPSGLIPFADRHPPAMQRVALTPNVSAFAALLRLLHPYADGSPGATSVVHDETASFEAVLRYYQSLVTDPVLYERTRSTSALWDYPRLDSLEGVRFRSSQSDVMLEAADILAGVIRALAGAIANESVLTGFATQLFLATFPALLDGELPTCKSIASDEFHAKLGSTLREALVTSSREQDDTGTVA